MSSYAMATFAEDDSIERENKIKTAYLFRFSQFTEWNEKPSVFHYCVYDDESFSELLKEAYRDKILGELSIEVQSINDSSNINSCQVIFFPNSAPLDLLTKISQKPILTIGMQKNFTQLGGIIHLFDDNQKIHFFIENNTALRAGLKISSQLLTLSKQQTQ
jgi:hypothetical protein